MFVCRLKRYTKTEFSQKVSNCLVHTGNKVDRIGDNVDRDKLLNSSCCRFVAGFSNNRLYRQCVPGLRAVTTIDAQ